MADGSVTPDMQSFSPSAADDRAFRDTLGCFATGVTVVTCQDAEGPLAITANSFAAVSLDPPLILWSPAKSSRRHDSFVAAEHFAVHVLAEDQLPLGRRFAMDGRDFTGLDWADDAGTPLLSDCLARFTCRRHATVPGGDHTVILGEVLQAAHRPGAPLIFARGAYGRFTGAS